MLFSIPLVFFNAYAAYSGLTYVEDFYYALYEVIMTTWAILAYLLLEIDVPPKFKNAGHSDSKVGEYLAKYYKHTREEEVEPMYKRLAIWAIFAWYSGAVFFYVSFF